MATSGLTPVLDATPAGRTVYAREGFSDRWGFTRFFLKERKTLARREAKRGRYANPTGRRSSSSTARRSAPAASKCCARCTVGCLQAAWMIEGKGFVFGRDGREASQIGPLIAVDAGSARTLLSHALAAVEPPLYVDAADHADLATFMGELGFALQRPFTRMVHGARAAPGRRELSFVVAGPELG